MSWIIYTPEIEDTLPKGEDFIIRTVNGHTTMGGLFKNEGEYGYTWELIESGRMLDRKLIAKIMPIPQ